MNMVKAGLVVVVAAAVIAASLASVSGCAAKRKSRESQSVERTYARMSFINETAAAVRVTVVVAERKDTPPGIGTSYHGEPQLIAPGGTYLALVQEKKTYGVGFLFPENQDLVVRFRLQSAGATWEPTHLGWYEVIGPMPPAIRILPSEAGAPTVMAETGRVELVPREWWPKE